MSTTHPTDVYRPECGGREVTPETVHDLIAGEHLSRPYVLGHLLGAIERKGSANAADVDVAIDAARVFAAGGAR